MQHGREQQDVRPDYSIEPMEDLEVPGFMDGLLSGVAVAGAIGTVVVLT
jgi:hypothetical protein